MRPVLEKKEHLKAITSASTLWNQKKEEAIKSTVSSRKQIIRIKDEINNLKKSIKQKTCSLIISIKQVSICQTEEGKREKIQIANIGNERGSITTNYTDIKRMIMEYYDTTTINSTTYKELNKLFEIYKLPKLIQ